MKKDLAVKTIYECAKKYRENLANNNLLFVFGDATSVDYVETLCLPQNYLHLTGVVIADKSTNSTNFLNMCLDGRLTSSNFEFSDDGTTVLKLSVLRQLMDIHKIAKMVGDYNANRIKLNTDKIIGHVSACMGFVRSKEYPKYFVPNTVLREDIRDVIRRPAKKVLAVFKKTRKDRSYAVCTYLAKNITLYDVAAFDDVRYKLNLK